MTFAKMASIMSSYAVEGIMSIRPESQVRGGLVVTIVSQNKTIPTASTSIAQQCGKLNSDNIWASHVRLRCDTIMTIASHSASPSA